MYAAASMPKSSDTKIPGKKVHDSNASFGFVSGKSHWCPLDSINEESYLIQNNLPPPGRRQRARSRFRSMGFSAVPQGEL
jgi:hypothetical protein